MKLINIPCVKDQAYYIMIGLSGSWLWNACHPQSDDLEWCKQFVQHFDDDCGLEYQDNYTHRSIQMMIDDGYDDLVRYKLMETIQT